MDIVDVARSNIGVPYRYGGVSPLTGFDCSGLVRWSYQQVGVQLPRSARDQNMFGTGVERQEDLNPGDIVVFKGTRGRTGWHSGIYTGAGKFVHSPHAGKTVTESRLDEEYYARRFIGARRIHHDGSASEMSAQHESRQRADVLATKEAKQSRRQMLAAKSATGGKGKTPAGKSGKNAPGKADAHSRAPRVATASKSGLAVAAAGAGEKGRADGDKAAKKPAKAIPSGKLPSKKPVHSSREL